MSKAACERKQPQEKLPCKHLQSHICVLISTPALVAGRQAGGPEVYLSYFCWLTHQRSLSLYMHIRLVTNRRKAAKVCTRTSNTCLASACPQASSSSTLIDRPALKLMTTRAKAVSLREPRLPRAHRRTRSERRKWWNCREAGRLERPPPPRQL